MATATTTKTKTKATKKTTAKKTTKKRATPKKNLVIVESPAKAKTIEKYLGRNYKVVASVGHIRDLKKSSMSIDFENNYEPQYINIRGIVLLINELKKENGGIFRSLDDVDTNEYKFDLEIDIETAIIRSELEREQLKVLQREINNLTKQQREVLYLKYYKKMSSDEIAQVMGLTSRTVYNTTHTAISRLREQLSKTFLLAVGANLWIFN